MTESLNLAKVSLEKASLEKASIADSFSRAATTYDDSAWYQRRVGDKLLAMIGKGVIHTCVDVGAGTGHFTRKLAKKSAFKRVVGVDLAEGMVRFASEQASNAKKVPEWLVADAEKLPFPTQSVDLIFSNMAIQWVQQPERLFEEWHRVLNAGGQVIFSTLLPATLHELADCWQKVDAYQHVNNFVSLPVLKQAIEQSGFSIQTWQRSIDVLQYDDLKNLVKELKGVGAHNINASRPKGMMGKQRWQQFQDAYEVLRTPQGTLPATWHVLYGVLSRD